MAAVAVVGTRDVYKRQVSNLVILENDIASSLDYSDLITDFAAMKTRKVTF